MSCQSDFTGIAGRFAAGLRAWGRGVVANVSVAFLVVGAADAVAQGITVEEYYVGVPPPPIVRPAGIVAGMILLRWDAPRRIKLPQQPGYDPQVAYYRVYRIDQNHDATLVGQTGELFFVVHMPESRGDDRYAVTAVQKSGQESPLSLEIDLPRGPN